MNNWFHSACNEKSSTRLPEVGINKVKVASSLKMSETGRVVKLYTILAQAALRAPSEVVLQCVAGHCYYRVSHKTVSTLILLIFRLPKQLL